MKKRIRMMYYKTKEEAEMALDMVLGRGQVWSKECEGLEVEYGLGGWFLVCVIMEEE